MSTERVDTGKVLDELKEASMGEDKFAGLPKHVYTLFFYAFDALAQERSDAEALRERIRVLEKFAESLSGLREGCLSAYAGGYTHSGDEDKLRIFQHGMNTVCNVIQARLNSLPESPAVARGSAEDEWNGKLEGTVTGDPGHYESE